MSFLLDTDICSHYLRGNARIHGRIVQHGGFYVSTVTIAELGVWVHRGGSERREGFQSMLRLAIALPLTLEVADVYGRTLAAMMDAGRPAPRNDMLIAATALHHDLTLVTHNSRDFANVPGLRIVDWTL